MEKSFGISPNVMCKPRAVLWFICQEKRYTVSGKLVTCIYIYFFFFYFTGVGGSDPASLFSVSGERDRSAVR